MGTAAATDAGYDAFISYRRRDGSAIAQWIRRELEAFRPPAAIRERYPGRFRLYLDTAYERGTSDFYRDSIRPALLASRWLIVVATPEAVRGAEREGDWIAREIADFRSGPNGGQIIAVRGGGEFAGPLPARLEAHFPNMEVVDLRGAGRLWRLNPHRAVRLTAEKLKIVAPLLDLPAGDMPRLRQEEEHRQQTRLGATLGVAVGVLTAVSGLSVFALQSRNGAIRALEDSMFASGSMVLLTTGLDRSGRAGEQAGLRRRLINQGCDLIDKLSSQSGLEPAVGEAVSCRLERARSREELNEPDEARRTYEEAIGLAADRYRRTRRTDAAERLLQARTALAESLVRARSRDDAKAEFGLGLDDARRFAALHPERPSFVQTEGETLSRLADLAADAGDLAGSAARLDEAAEAVSRLVRLRGRPATAINWLTELYRRAGERLLRLGDLPGARERFGRSVEAAGQPASPDASPWDTVMSRAVAHAAIYDLERRAGHPEEARAAYAAALALIGQVLAAPDSSADLKSKATGLRTWLGRSAAAARP